MVNIQSISDLDALITAQIPEDSQLEYKAAPAINDKGEIGKDVSAMANAAGGTIVYGIAESAKGVPFKLDPITSKSTEYLDQVIGTQITPPISCEILTIPFQGGEIFVVKVPPGVTAHQAKKDLKYHRRRNNTTYAMEDYEIRDIMSRLKHPDVNLTFSIKSKRLDLAIVNHGPIFGKYIRYECMIPAYILNHEYRYEMYTIDGMEYCKIFWYGDKVLHPDASDVIMSMGLSQHAVEMVYFKLQIITLTIFWKVWADNAPIKTDKVDLSNIEVLDFNSR